MDVEVDKCPIEVRDVGDEVTAGGKPIWGIEPGEFVLPEAWWFHIQDPQQWMDLSA